jgi:Bacteriophage HK97-gp10, putative tail-component
VSRFDQSAVKGLADTKAAFKQVEPTFKAKLADAAEETARVIAFGAQQRVRRRFGILAAHIRWAISRTTGVAKVGIGPREDVRLPHGAGVERPTKIAHDVEFGHGGPHPAPAYPFLIPAAEAERTNYVQRVHAAGAEAERAIAATGGGLL